MVRKSGSNLTEAASLIKTLMKFRTFKIVVRSTFHRKKPWKRFLKRIFYTSIPLYPFWMKVISGHHLIFGEEVNPLTFRPFFCIQCYSHLPVSVNECHNKKEMCVNIKKFASSESLSTCGYSVRTEAREAFFQKAKASIMQSFAESFLIWDRYYLTSMLSGIQFASHRHHYCSRIILRAKWNKDLTPGGYLQQLNLPWDIMCIVISKEPIFHRKKCFAINGFGTVVSSGTASCLSGFVITWS